MQSVLEYYWVKTLLDGSKIAQFDELGNRHRWYDNDVPIRAVSWEPFSVGLAEKVTAMNGILTIALNHKPVIVTVKPNDKVHAQWDNGIETSTPYRCDECGWQWMTVAAYEFPTCPQCGTHDEFFCEDCNHLIDPTRVLRPHNGQLNCPDCDHPQGLIRKTKLRQIAVRRDFTEYVTEVAGKFRVTITDSGAIKTESL